MPRPRPSVWGYQISRGFGVPQLSLPKTRNDPRFLVVLKDPETTSRTVETGSL